MVRHILDIFQHRRTPLYKSRAEASSRGAPAIYPPGPANHFTHLGRAFTNSGQRPANHFTRTPDSGPPTADPEQRVTPYHRRTPSTTPAAHGSPALEGQTPLHRSPHSTSSSREVSTSPTSPVLPHVLCPPLLLPSLSREMWRGWSGLVVRRETPHQPQEQTPEQGEGGGRGLACFIWHASCYSTDRASPEPWRGGGGCPAVSRAPCVASLQHSAPPCFT
jgi:hypothetical protein